MIKKAIHKIFSLAGYRLQKIRKEKQKTAKQYFNTGELTPLQENSKELYDSFYGDDHALQEYYDDEYRLGFFNLIMSYLESEKISFNDKDVIDVGCGVGFLLLAIKEKFHTRSLTGSDFSQNAIDFSKKKFPGINFFRQDLNDPIPGNYDIILCTEVLEHLEKPYLAIKNMLNALRPGGTMIITVPNGRYDSLNEHINFWSPESWRFFLERECNGCDIRTSVYAQGKYNINMATIILKK
jgi:2-polyprenyl-3-methyl-5-hydroxy-6-metoxy-1,4-benzoquinol methylase